MARGILHDVSPQHESDSDNPNGLIGPYAHDMPADARGD